MRKSNFALRLQPSLLEELRGVADAEDTTLNQFINVAVAEKLTALRTEAYFRDRAARADIPMIGGSPNFPRENGGLRATNRTNRGDANEAPVRR
jgi:hypothetical protein